MAKRRGNREGSIFRRGDGRWVASMSLPGGHRKSFYAKTRREAAEKLRQAQNARAQGLPVGGDQITTGAFLKTWLRDSATQRVRPRTLRGYEQIVQLHLVPSLGRVPLTKLTPRHVERMMNVGLEARRSPQSVCHDRAVLRTALNVAMRWDLVGRNVAGLVTPPRVPKREVTALTGRGARRILAAVRGDRLEALIAVAVAVGLRQSEALGLRWSDVDLDKRTISIRRVLQRHDGAFHLTEPKTHKSRRVVDMPRPVSTALREHRTRQLEERLRVGGAWKGDQWGELIFANEWGGPLHGTSVGKHFRKLIQRSGLPPMRYHDLRHGAASIMAAEGVPARIAMEVLGHSQISTTMDIYSHVASESQRIAADRVEAAIWGAS